MIHPDRLVAEGVDTELQADLLTGLERDELQGNLTARPVPADAVHTFLAGEPGREDVHLDRAA